jgi:Icc protein
MQQKSMGNDDAVQIAQISDLHIRQPSSRSAEEFERLLDDCIARVNALGADLVLATGDLTESGKPAEYERLRLHLQKLSPPWRILPGNHDDRNALRRVFHDQAYLFENTAHISYAVDLGAVRVLALDSTAPGKAAGYLDAERLAWVQAQLDMDPQRPVLLALHHPPFRAGVWPMDWLHFAGLRELTAIVARSPQIRRVVSGHVHAARSASWAGTFACTSPSTRTQRLVIRDRRRLPSFRKSPGGFLLHHFSGNDAVKTILHRMDGTSEELR